MRPIAAALSLSALAAAAVAGLASADMAGSWRNGAAMERPRAGLAAAALGANVYVGGGAGLLAPASDFDLYEAGLAQWRELAPLPSPRARFGMASLGEKIYIAGGFGGEEGAVATAASYSPAVDAWTPIADMPSARAGHALAAADGKLYALGGSVGAVDVYDPATGEWSRVGDERAELARPGAAAAAFGGDLYLIGGRLDDEASDRVDVFDPATGAWREGPALPAPRAGIAGAVLDGQLHVLGGSNAAGLDAAVDHWVLSADGVRWEQAPELPAPRADFAAAPADGRLIVLGGGTGGGFFGPFTAAGAVDVFEPAG